MWIFEDTFHTLFGLPAFGGATLEPFVADWLKDKLDGKCEKDLNRQVMLSPNGRGPY